MFGSLAKNWIFHQDNILWYNFSKSMHGWLSFQGVCKIGLKKQSCDMDILALFVKKTK
jgi:hypothetical protein